MVIARTCICIIILSKLWEGSKCYSVAADSKNQVAIKEMDKRY